MRTPTLSLRTHLVEQTTESWMFWFGLLETFVKETGNCRVLDSYRTNDGYQLGKWIGKQRAKKDSMDAAYRQLLEALPGWLGRPSDTATPQSV